LITAEQRLFLQNRPRDALKKPPQLKKLKALLVKLGGEFLVPCLKPDLDLEQLLD